MSGKRFKAHPELPREPGDDDERRRANPSGLDLSHLVYRDACPAGHIDLLAARRLTCRP